MAYYSRKPTRIPGYNYSNRNYYFITICTYEKACIFGTINRINEWGEIAKNDLQQISSHFTDVYVDNCIVMPNHIHAIIVIDKDNSVNLNHVVGLYKSGVSRKIHKIQPNVTVWQRSFHDHIIRNQAEYEKIWEYVTFNRQKWETDCFYPKIDKN